MVPAVTSAGSVTLLEDDSAFSELLDFVELLNATELLDFTLLLDTLVSLSLDFGVTLDDDDLAPLLLDFVELLQDPSWLSLLRMTLSLLDDDSSQSSHTLEDEPSEGRVAKSLSSSPQAASIAAKDMAIQPTKSFFIVFTYFPKKTTARQVSYRDTFLLPRFAQ